MLRIGSKVHCILYGGRDGIIYNISGEQRPDTVKSMGGGVCVSGGGADFDIVWEDGTMSKHTPEGIVVGSVQWRILEGIANPQEIIDALEFAESENNRKQLEAKAAAEQREIDRQALKEKYSYLKQYPDSGGKGAAQNMRIELKKEWPKIKFSVKSDYSRVNVSWTDGPTEAQVKNIIDKYQGGHFNGMEDIYEHSTDAFNDVFGSVNYVFTNRDISETLFNRAFSMLKKQYSGNIDNDFTCTIEDWKNGKLWNVSMNTGGVSHRDNLNSYMNGITHLLPEDGYELKPSITKIADGVYNVHYYDYRYGKYYDREENSIEDAMSFLSWDFWKNI